MNEKLALALQNLLQGQDTDSVNFFFKPLCEEDQAIRVDLNRGIACIIDGETGDEIKIVRFSIDIQHVE